MIAAWSQNAQVLDQAMARADQRYGLFRREESILIEPFVGRELMAVAEQSLQILLRDVAMSRRHIHNQTRPLLSPRSYRARGGGEAALSGQLALQRRPHQPLS